MMNSLSFSMTSYKIEEESTKWWFDNNWRGIKFSVNNHFKINKINLFIYLKAYAFSPSIESMWAGSDFRKDDDHAYPWKVYFFLSPYEFKIMTEVQFIRWYDQTFFPKIEDYLNQEPDRILSFTIVYYKNTYELANKMFYPNDEWIETNMVKILPEKVESFYYSRKLQHVLDFAKIRKKNKP
jgi:hypothetical protein